MSQVPPPFSQVPPPSGVPWPPILLAGCFLAALLWDWWVLPLPVPFAEVDIVHGLGWLLLATAGGLLIWSALAFWRHKTTIRPDRPASALIESGPYAWSRNPIYLADATALMGLGLALNRLSLVVMTAVFVALVARLAIRPEEQHLERRFPQAFAAYRTRVRRWL
ncbi:MAG: isoprenylcysteine carboxylmethyltransferase family protein [Hyphomicrobiaceae bacterium]